MSKRKSSIISELIILAISLYFLYNAVFVLKWQKQWYRSGSLFPIIVSIVVVGAALAGLYQDIAGKNKRDTKKINIGNLKRLPAVLSIMVAELIVWQVFGYFYAAMFVGTSLMIAMMNVVQRDWKKRIRMAVGISAVFIVFVYVLFDKICQIAL